jgi:putative NADH-flavin reductase
MRIAVLGASGAVGSAVVREAVSRGHDVTGVVRREPVERPTRSVRYVAANAAHIAEVMSVAANHDIVVSATRPRAGSEHELVQVARVVLTAAARTGSRALIVGGAATLRVADAGGRLVLDDARYLPPAARRIAEACAAQHEVCAAAADADWTYLSPPARLFEGARSGTYRVGTDDLIVAADGDSSVSIADLAAALLDEIDRPRHRRRRFTVAY